jgi:CRISPR-associated protein Cas1
MKRNFYIFSNGRLQRKENTLFFVSESGERKIVPIETVRSLYVFGEADFNVKMLDFLTQHEIMLHVFNYYGFYSGSYVPRETLLSGEVIVRQVKHFTMPAKQLILASELLSAVVVNILKNLQYYQSRGRELEAEIEQIRKTSETLSSCTDPTELMGVEGQIRQIYYDCFPKIISQEIEFEKRVRRPPDNMINTLISFGNSLLYTSTLGEIYKTQLNPTISFLHAPGYRRYSLALDISEIFKPILVDRIIFRLLNKNMISEKDFEKDLNYCYMKEKAKKIFLKEYDDQLSTTIKHRKLNRSYSYRYLIRLECYKLIKTIIEKKEYEAFRIWW